MKQKKRLIQNLTERLVKLLYQQSAVFFAQRPFLESGGEVIISDNPELARKDKELSLEVKKTTQELSRLLTPPKVTYVQPSITGI